MVLVGLGWFPIQRSRFVSCLCGFHLCMHSFGWIFFIRLVFQSGDSHHFLLPSPKSYHPASQRDHTGMKVEKCAPATVTYIHAPSEESDLSAF